MICEVCGKEHDGSYGSGRFCSRSCGCKYSAISRSKECLNFIKQKVQNSKSLSKERKQKEYEATPKVCKNCGETYYKNWAKTVKSDFCSRECARSFSTKIKRDEISKKVSDKLKGRLVGNALNTKGLKLAKAKLPRHAKLPRYTTVDELRDEYSKNPNKCEFCGKELSYERRQRKTCSRKCQDELWKMWYDSNKELMVERGFCGGYRKGAARGKSGYYKGIWCDSTYELVFLIYNLDNESDIKRNTTKFPYSYNGKSHEYIPDFRVNGELVEIKNFWTELVQVKLDCVTEKISILYYEDLEEMMQYVDSKYGTWHKRKKNNYEILYDK